MSIEIRPLAPLYFPPSHTKKNVLYRSLSGHQGRYAHAYGICTHFYCISLKKIYGGREGYNAARGPILRNIAYHSICSFSIYPYRIHISAYLSDLTSFTNYNIYIYLYSLHISFY